MFSKISLNVLRRYLITILVVLAALFIGWRLWIHYENDPWTRDGRIKADVVQVAPDVTGQVVKSTSRTTSRSMSATCSSKSTPPVSILH